MDGIQQHQFTLEQAIGFADSIIARPHGRSSQIQQLVSSGSYQELLPFLARIRAVEDRMLGRAHAVREAYNRHHTVDNNVMLLMRGDIDEGQTIMAVVEQTLASANQEEEPHDLFQEILAGKKDLEEMRSEIERLAEVLKTETNGRNITVLRYKIARDQMNYNNVVRRLAPLEKQLGLPSTQLLETGVRLAFNDRESMKLLTKPGQIFELIREEKRASLTEADRDQALEDLFAMDKAEKAHRAEMSTKNKKQSGSGKKKNGKRSRNLRNNGSKNGGGGSGYSVRGSESAESSGRATKVPYSLQKDVEATMFGPQAENGLRLVYSTGKAWDQANLTINIVRSWSKYSKLSDAEILAQMKKHIGLRFHRLFDNSRLKKEYTFTTEYGSFVWAHVVYKDGTKAIGKIHYLINPTTNRGFHRLFLKAGKTTMSDFVSNTGVSAEELEDLAAGVNEETEDNDSTRVGQCSVKVHKDGKIHMKLTEHPVVETITVFKLL